MRSTFTSIAASSLLVALFNPIDGLAQVPADPGTLDRHRQRCCPAGNCATGSIDDRAQAQSPIVISTLPKATCALHPGDTTQSVKLYAGWKAMFRFHAGASAESEMPAPSVLDCE